MAMTGSALRRSPDPRYEAPSKPVYTQRISVRIYPSGFHWTGWGSHLERLKASWPLGKLALYRDHLTIGSFMRTYRLDYADVKRIRKTLLFSVQIEHDDGTVPGCVFMQGWFLLNSIRQAVRANGLRIRVE